MLGEFGYGKPIGREPRPNRKLKTLKDYRERHAFYKLDPDLQAAHAAHPWIVVWDDHEFEDDIDSTQSSSPFVQEALQAYFEYLPVRENTILRRKSIYRSFQFGRLVDLIMLDTRLAGREITNQRSSSIVQHENRTVKFTQFAMIYISLEIRFSEKSNKSGLRMN